MLYTHNNDNNNNNNNNDIKQNILYHEKLYLQFSTCTNYIKNVFYSLSFPIFVCYGWPFVNVPSILRWWWWRWCLSFWALSHLHLHLACPITLIRRIFIIIVVSSSPQSCMRGYSFVIVSGIIQYLSGRFLGHANECPFIKSVSLLTPLWILCH